MIGCIFFLNNRGEVILGRQFRDCISVRALADKFRAEMTSQRELAQCAPVNIIHGTCYIHLTIGDIILVMTSKNNVNCMAAMQYGIRLAQMMIGYFRKVSENVIRENFATLLEMIDESVDFGYPLSTDAAATKLFITNGGIDHTVVRDLPSAEIATKALCGEVPWRTAGLVYHVNEMFVDVFEEMNMLLSREGAVLTSSVVGKVLVKNFLSGMPQCELVLNARAFGDATGTELHPEEPVAKLEDVAFHPCVRLNRYDEEQKLKFVPPDGEFTLMTYRSSVTVSPPLSIIGSRFEEISSTRTEMQFSLKSEFSGQQVAEKVKLFIPCPDTTATVKINVGKGVAKYIPASHEIVWKLNKVGNGEEITFAAETHQIAITSSEEAAWERPPIRLEFEFLSESLTGLRISALPVVEPVQQYQTRKWIRYKTKAGHYQCRISSEKVRS